MAEEAERNTASRELRDKCTQKLNLIEKQMRDLIQAYDLLIDELLSGKRRFALYRQFKMYNDPDLNPMLYKNKVTDGTKSE